MCFNKLLTFILAIFRPFNLVTQCNAESNSPIVGPRHALPELSFLTSNSEVPCIVELSLVGLLAGLVVVPADVLALKNPFAASLVFPMP